MLEENVNTYATVMIADEYISEHLMPFAPLRVHFSVLTEAEKEGYLRASLQEIERLMFVGRKIMTDQSLAFPRIRNNEDSGVPTCVKEAQVENALAILLREISGVSDKQFMTMQSLGSVKNTKYNKREAGDLGFGDEITGEIVSRKCPLTSKKAFDLLRSWLGGIAVC